MIKEMMIKMETIEKIILTVGLPGSGKTRFCENYLENNKDKEVNHIEFDKYIEATYGKKLSFESILLKGMKEFFDEILLIDALLLTNNDVIKSINILKENLENIENIDIEIHYWNLDRESCLHNDKERREKNSELTIKEALLEELNIEEIKNATSLEKIVIFKHDVVRKSNLQLALDMTLTNSLNVDECNAENRKYLYSDKWLIEGTRRYYVDSEWNQGYRNLDRENPILEFKEFDDIIENICPALTFIEYRELKRLTVDIEEIVENDYYTYATYERWRCDLYKLEEYLKSKNYLD